MLLGIAGLLGAGAGCESPAPGGRGSGRNVPQLDPVTATAAGLPAAEVLEGHRLVVAKCVRCHKFYAPADYTEPEWNSWMAKMSRKAHLDPAQNALLTRYLEAFRSVPGQQRAP